MRNKEKKVVWLYFWIGILLQPIAAQAGDLLSFDLELHNGTMTPSRLVVPANIHLKINLHNSGDTPAEFESRRLRQEKVLGPGAKSFVVIYPLKPGEYEFIDEFHLPDAKGVIVAE